MLIDLSDDMTEQFPGHLWFIYIEILTMTRADH